MTQIEVRGAPGTPTPLDILLDPAIVMLVDMLFGTSRNPPAFARKTGYWHGASARVADMLLLRDVPSPQR